MENIAGTYKSNKFISREKKLFTGLACEKVNKLLLDADGRLFAGTAQGLFTLKNEAFTPLFANRLKGGISALAALPEGTVAAASGNDIYFIKGSSLKKARTFESEIVDIAYAREHVWVLTKQKLICSDAELKNDINDNFLEGGEGVALAVDENNMYAATESYLSLIHGKRNEWKNIMPGFSNMPEGKILSLAFDSLGYLRSGFRAKYLVDAVSKVLSGELDLESVRTLPLDDARNALMKIKGVGPKVADCTLLFGFYRLDAFPKDVWVKRVLAQWYPNGLPDCTKGLEGIAQQYLFHYIRTQPSI